MSADSVFRGEYIRYYISPNGFYVHGSWFTTPLPSPPQKRKQPKLKEKSSRKTSISNRDGPVKYRSKAKMITRKKTTLYRMIEEKKKRKLPYIYCL